MKLTLLLLPLLITICAAVSKSHLKGPVARFKEGPIGIAIPAGARLVRIKAIVTSPINQRITLRNTQGMTETWEGTAESDELNQIGITSITDIPEDGTTWTITIEHLQDGDWKSSPSKKEGPFVAVAGGTEYHAVAKFGQEMPFDAKVYVTYYTKLGS